MSGMRIAQWRPIAGSGQSLTLAASTNQAFANPIGSQTYAIAVSLAPASTAAYALVTISAANGGTGTAATASKDYMIKTSDPPQILACTPGEIVNVYSSATGTAFMVGLTH